MHSQVFLRTFMQLRVLLATFCAVAYPSKNFLCVKGISWKFMCGRRTFKNFPCGCGTSHDSPYSSTTFRNFPCGRFIFWERSVWVHNLAGTYRAVKGPFRKFPCNRVAFWELSVRLQFFWKFSVWLQVLQETLVAVARTLLCCHRSFLDLSG